MRVPRVLLVLAVACGVGCEDGFDDSSPAPACTDDLGCPEGSRCVQGLFCERVDDAGPGGGPVGVPEAPTGGSETPGAIDGGSPQLDGGIVLDGGVAPRFDSGLCVGAQVACGGLCVDTQSDVQNCGGCGIACTGAALCSGGVCCGALFDVCGGACVDLTNDPRHCGVCGLACPQGTECSLGACVTPLPGPAL